MQKANIKKRLLPLLALLLAAGAVFLLLPREKFDGERIARPDTYRLDIRQMTGTDRHTMLCRRETCCRSALPVHRARCICPSPPRMGRIFTAVMAGRSRNSRSRSRPPAITRSALRPATGRDTCRSKRRRMDYEAFSHIYTR